MGPIQLVVSDFDRTFTNGSLYLDPGMLEMIKRVRAKGIRFSIVSGRKFSFMMDLYGQLEGYIDSFVAENGCIGYINGDKEVLSDCADRHNFLKRLEEMGVPYDPGDIVVSVDREYEAKLMSVLDDYRSLHVIMNIDSMMVLPHDVSKALGVRWLKEQYGFSTDMTACIGDAENDVVMRDQCSLLGAVSNALPRMKDTADYVCNYSFGNGLREFLEYIDRNYS